jgi:putative addiction module component (TIGR02574 family)
MDALSQQILNAALSLPEHDRAVLAAELIESLDPSLDTEPDLESAWSEEIARRISAIDSGVTKLIPWEEVRARITGR